MFLARIQCLNSKLKPNLFPNQNKIKDLPRKSAYCILDFFNEVLNFLLIFSLYTIPARVVSEVGCNVSLLQ